MRNRFNREEDSGYGTAFRDILFVALGVVMAVALILLLLPKNPKEASSEQERSRGNIRVEIFWPDKMNVDIDLWGKAPGSSSSVGYSNMNGPILNLVRDDLGTYADITGINYEVMFSRGLPQGEWIFNVHWYSNQNKVLQVPVDIIITYKKDDSTSSKERPKQIVSTSLTLNTEGEEKTIVRFKLDEDGDLILDSMNSIFKPIRAMASDDGWGTLQEKMKPDD